MTSRIAADAPSVWPAARAAVDSRGGTAHAVAGSALLPGIAGLLAVGGVILLFVATTEPVAMPASIPAAGKHAVTAERVVPPGSGRADPSILGASTPCAARMLVVPTCRGVFGAPRLHLAMAAPQETIEQYSGEGRTLDILATPAPVKLRRVRAMLAAAQYVRRRPGPCNGAGQNGPCLPPMCCGQAATLSAGEATAFSASIPQDVLDELVRRTANDPEHEVRSARDTGLAKPGNNDPNADAVDVSTTLPP